MAIETVCLTSGCVFHTHITPKGWSIEVEFPDELDLNEEDATLATDLLHNQVELILALLSKMQG